MGLINSKSPHSGRMDFMKLVQKCVTQIRRNVSPDFAPEAPIPKTKNNNNNDRPNLRIMAFLLKGFFIEFKFGKCNYTLPY